MTGLFGPQNANAVDTLPVGTSRQRYGAKQTFVKDCTAPGRNDGTVLDAAFYNRIIGNLDFLVSQSGIVAKPGEMSAIYRAVLASVRGDAAGLLAELHTVSALYSPEIVAALAARLRFDAAQTLSTQQKTQARSNLGLPTFGTSATYDVGTTANKLIALDGNGKLPAVDGSQLSGVIASIGARGQCVLSLAGGNLVLKPKNGNLLTVNGVPCAVPDAGVSLSATGLTASTLYYIYAAATAGVITSLEATTTARATSTATGNKGVEIKSGDNSRTLVGMGYVSAGPVWSLYRSWFNDPGFRAIGAISAVRTVATTSFSEVHAEIRTPFLSWAGELVQTTSAGGFNPNASGVTGASAIGYDGTVDGYSAVFLADNTGSVGPCATRSATNALAEGYHYASLYGLAPSSSVSWQILNGIPVSICVTAGPR